MISDECDWTVTALLGGRVKVVKIRGGYCERDQALRVRYPNGWLQCRGSYSDALDFCDRHNAPDSVIRGLGRLMPDNIRVELVSQIHPAAIRFIDPESGEWCSSMKDSYGNEIAAGDSVVHYADGTRRLLCRWGETGDKELNKQVIASYRLIQAFS